MKSCPNCKEEMAKGKTLGLRAIAKTEAGKKIDAMPKCYICPKCGYVWLFVDKEKL